MTDQGVVHLVVQTGKCFLEKRSVLKCMHVYVRVAAYCSLYVVMSFLFLLSEAGSFVNYGRPSQITDRSTSEALSDDNHSEKPKPSFQQLSILLFTSVFIRARLLGEEAVIAVRAVQLTTHDTLVSSECFEHLGGGGGALLRASITEKCHWVCHV